MFYKLTSSWKVGPNFFLPGCQVSLCEKCTGCSNMAQTSSALVGLHTELCTIKHSSSNCLLGTRSWPTTLSCWAGCIPESSKATLGHVPLSKLDWWMHQPSLPASNTTGSFLKGFCLLSANTHGAISQLAGLVCASCLPACSGLPTPCWKPRSMPLWC